MVSNSDKIRQSKHFRPGLMKGARVVLRFFAGVRGAIGALNLRQAFALPYFNPAFRKGEDWPTPP